MSGLRSSRPRRHSPAPAGLFVIFVLCVSAGLGFPRAGTPALWHRPPILNLRLDETSGPDASVADTTAAPVDPRALVSAQSRAYRIGATARTDRPLRGQLLRISLPPPPPAAL
jgi:hypothetical protein